jgi:hypothetical protein
MASRWRRRRFNKKFKLTFDADSAPAALDSSPRISLSGTPYLYL